MKRIILQCRPCCLVWVDPLAVASLDKADTILVTRHPCNGAPPSRTTVPLSPTQYQRYNRAADIGIPDD